MRDLIFLQVVPIDIMFWWQIKVQLYNFKKYGYDKLAHILIFISSDKIPLGIPDKWKELEKEYPDTKFEYIQDTDNLTGTLIRYTGYIPLLRPYCLAKYFKAHPEFTKAAIFYHDSDIVFTKKLDFSPYLEDEINYLSDTSSYNGADYFASKRKDVVLFEVQEYDKIDVLAESANMVGITKDVVVKNQNRTGGAQYLFKNIDAEFWQDVFTGCVKLKLYLAGINKRYFPSEDAGFQSWTADMWSVLWNLWKRGAITETPQWMNFAWATDGISKWNDVYMYHDAGAGISTPHLFHKRKIQYVNNISTPFEDDLSYVSPEYCSYNYVNEIIQTKNTINDEKT